ncbi:MAG TPA: PQQ-binding-like beta-propeller repeat protein [Steroidobacteraceae bacterium]|jgi:PQQ-dependent dehydrogenase (methanol/ethanol family)|nr:PQQ-binding-like beta-propeller repeat protein [Steroidobacteraceae bacterium]
MATTLVRKLAASIGTALLAAVPGMVTSPAVWAAGANMEWPSYGRDYANSRYAPLNQINAGTVQGLAPAWIFQTGKTGSFEDSPVVVGGVMYVTSGVTNSVFALDAGTGRRLWTHDTVLGFASFCCGPNNRGVAVAGGKVFYGTLDGKLVALDASTGKQAWSVQVGDPKEGFSETMAPLAWNGRVFIGSSGGEYGIRGSLTAYSQDDGKQLWRWWVVGPGWEGKYVSEVHGYSLHRDIAQEKADAAKYADSWKHGGGPIWTTPALDARTGTLYVSTGNPAEQLIDKTRPGDNLYTDSIVALDAGTGRMKWYYQETPHDGWDYDAASPPVLFDAADGSGRTVPAVGEAGKTGWFYILRRSNGDLLRVSEPFVPITNIYTRPTAGAVTETPGGTGGSNWSPVSYNPGLHLVYIAGLNVSLVIDPKPPAQWNYGGQRWAGSHQHPVAGEPFGGTFTAIDPSTGKIVWQDTMRFPMTNGSLATPELTFVGEATGMFDALDARTGKILWQFQTGAGITAPPVAYEIDGREYVAVASGGGYGGGGDAVVVFALPQSAQPSPD